MSQLLKAYDYAQDLECSLWDFSVEIERLFALGITTSDLRWLVKRGFISHAEEIAAGHEADRRFDAESQSLAFSSSTCFALTVSGLGIMGRDISAESILALPRMAAAENGQTELGRSFSSSNLELPSRNAAKTAYARGIATRQAPSSSAVPNWDRDTRTFLVGEHLVKQFRVPSPNQEAVLEAFQEEGWPRSVDDPLPPVPDQQPKRRLRDTIKCLNMNQVSRAIRFRGDGTGQRVFWELLIESDGQSCAADRAASSGKRHRRAA